ncbi:CHAP domain-containing protein [Salmonella enterica subsp. enterica]|nr:CHAP domain-containing protein [Salmonella enterica subsp. enterica serovar Telelkebir]
MSEVVTMAASQVGVQEQPRGSNQGPEVSQYLQSVGINFPAAWCAAFVVWCHVQAGISSIPHTGGVLDMWNKARSDHAVAQPQPGDVFIMDFGRGKGHAGIVERVEGDTLHTIEGNTDASGGREGYEVARRTRKLSSIKGILRFS